MKLILSRKSFDSSYGGKPNLIFSDDTLLPLPIPGNKYVSGFDFNHEKYDPTEYIHLNLPKSVLKLLEDNNLNNITNYADLMLNLFEKNKGKTISELKNGLHLSSLTNAQRIPYYCHLDPDLIRENLTRIK